jgi:hypothetical protein
METREAIKAHLTAFGLTQETMYVAGDDDEPTAYCVVTDAGLYVGMVHANEQGSRLIEGTLTAWNEVRGAHMSFSGFIGQPGGPMTLTVTIGQPRFKETVQAISPRTHLLDTRRRDELRDFALVCMRRQRGTPERA